MSKRKPRLTAPVMRGLLDMAASFSADDLEGMQESGIIDSVTDINRAMRWVWEMRDYRTRAPHGAEEGTQ